MTNSASAVQARSLSKSFRGRLVFRDIDLDIAGGECVALTGDNGIGKTTLLRCLAATARPTTGEVRWFGRLPGARADQRRLVGVTAHESRLYANLTIRENLLFAARMCGLSRPALRTSAMLEGAGLSLWADRQVRELSKGMCQRLALVRVLIHDPPILLLDEPFSGLDQAGRDWLVGLLQERRRAGCAVCFSTHAEGQVQQLVDRTLCLRTTMLTDVAHPMVSSLAAEKIPLAA